MSETPIMLLTSKEAAKALRISERQLWRITDDGLLPCVKIGRLKRYDNRDLEAYIKRAKEPGGPLPFPGPGKAAV
jgi:excisionase family DNA binding protein